MLYEIKVPEAGFNIAEATVSKWFRNIGEKIEKGEIIVSVDTDKINVEIPAEGSGFLREIRFQVGQTAPVGEIIGTITDTLGEAVAAPAAAGPAKEEAPAESEVAVGYMFGEAEAATEAGKKRKISPTAKAIARAEGVDLSLITTGTGPGGRIIKEDVLAFIEKKKAVQAGAAPAKPAEKAPEAPAKAAPAAEAVKFGETIKFASWRKVIADRMLAAKRNVPHYNNAVDIDVTDLAQFIRSTREKNEKVRMTYLPFIIKAMTVGIDLIPEINAFAYEDGFSIQKDINAGVAVDLGQKLIVPVVKDVRNKTILQLAQEIQEIIEKARNEKLEPKDIQDGTITITNAGVYGILYGTPIILQPQTTILSVGAVQDVPAVHKGLIEIRKKMIVVCSFDHRVVNGGPAARFMREFKNNMEDLNKLLINMR